MDASADKVLYVWIQGDPYHAPEVRLMAAPAMDLADFKQRYVDSARGYLIVRVGQVSDQPLEVHQEPTGLLYNVTLVSAEAAAPPGTSATNAISSQSDR
jgi:hypothetical protein